MDELDGHDHPVTPAWLHDINYKDSMAVDISGLEPMDWAVTMSNPGFIETSNQLASHTGSGSLWDFRRGPVAPGIFSAMSVDPSSSMDWTSNLVSAYLSPIPDCESSGGQFIHHPLGLPAVESPAPSFPPSHSHPAMLDEHMSNSPSSSLHSDLPSRIPSLKRETEDSVTGRRQHQLPLRIVSCTEKRPGSRRALHSPQVWDSHKSTIKRLYIDEGKPLREVMRAMQEQHNFKASVKMYKTKLAQWRFEKNNTEKEMAQILHLKFRRDTAGKLSSFDRNGKKIDIQRYLQRKGLTEYDLVDFGSSADLPNFLHCRTPSPSPEYLSSPEAVRHQELLLLHFRDVIQYQRRIDMSKGIDYSWKLSNDRIGAFQTADLATSLRRAAQYRDQGSAAQSLAYLKMSYGYLDSFFDNPEMGDLLNLLTVLGADIHVIALNFWKYAAASAKKRQRHRPLHRLLTFVYTLIQAKNIDTAWEVVKSCLLQLAEEMERLCGFDNLLMVWTWREVQRCFPYEAESRIHRLICSLRKERQLTVRAGKYDEKELIRILWWSFELEQRFYGISNDTLELSNRMAQIARSTGNDNFEFVSLCTGFWINKQLSRRQDARYNPRHGLAIFNLEKCIQLDKIESLTLDLMLQLAEMYREAGWDMKADEVMVQYEARTAAFAAKWHTSA